MTRHCRGPKWGDVAKCRADIADMSPNTTFRPQNWQQQHPTCTTKVTTTALLVIIKTKSGTSIIDDNWLVLILLVIVSRWGEDWLLPWQPGQMPVWLPYLLAVAAMPTDGSIHLFLCFSHWHHDGSLCEVNFVILLCVCKHITGYFFMVLQYINVHFVIFGKDWTKWTNPTYPIYVFWQNPF